MSGEKTEAPTQHRLDTLRRRGEVATSREVTRGAAAFGLALCLIGIGGEALRSIFAWANWLWKGEAAPATALRTLLEHVGTLILAPLLVAAIFSIAAGVLFTGGLLAPTRMMPKWSRLRPGQAWKGRMRPERLAVAGLSALAALGGALIVLSGLLSLRSETLQMLEAARTTDLDAALRIALRPLAMAMAAMAGVCAAVVMLDAALQRRLFLRRNRMSPREIRDEEKALEGDPLVKAMREEARHAWQEEGVETTVRRADLVVRNPSHLAIALRYAPDEGDEAPRIVARGRGLRARTILRVAHRHAIPCWRDRRTARILIEGAPGDVIPESTWEAVAILYRALEDKGD